MKKLKPHILPPLLKLPGFCEQFQARAQKLQRPYASGQHIQVWRGQSMEFRDFAPYTLGDDIRYVDWRVSMRSGDETKWFIRRFQAEESLHLVISIDTRDSMYLPQKHLKINYAAWGVEAIARLGLRSDDKVYLHRLFGKRKLVQLSRPSSVRRLVPSMQDLVHDADVELPDLKMNLDQLKGGFFNNAVWVIFSDFYFLSNPDFKRKLTSFIRTSEQGWRWVILINLDSWPYEAKLLSDGSQNPANRVTGPGRNDFEDFEATSDAVAVVEKNIKESQTDFLKAIQREAFDQNWHWPEKNIDDPLKFLSSCFTHEPQGNTKRQNPFNQLFKR